MNIIEIGNRIKERRQELNLTLQQVADKVKVNKSTIQRYEAGNIKDVKLPVIESIANVLNVNLLWLIGKIDIVEKHSEEYEHITYLINLYFKSVMVWSEDQFFNEQKTVIIREHFSDLLSRYKKMIEKLVDATLHWNNCKDSYSDLYKNRETPLSDKEIEELFLKQELENDIENITNWIKAFPNWIARKEDELKVTKNNVTELISTTKEDKEEKFILYKSLDQAGTTIAAHDDDLTDEEKERADKILLDHINNARLKEFNKKHNIK